jgi:hypothetical protein
LSFRLAQISSAEGGEQDRHDHDVEGAQQESEQHGHRTQARLKKVTEFLMQAPRRRESFPPLGLRRGY